MKTLIRLVLVIFFVLVVGPLVAVIFGTWCGLDAWCGTTLTLWKRLK